MGTVHAWDMPTFKGGIDDGDSTRPAADYQLHAGLGTIASTQGNPKTGKPFLTRSEARKHAESTGGRVIEDGKSFTVSNQIPGADVNPPGADRKANPVSTVVTPSGREVQVRHRVEIGRASCRVRVGQYV